MTTPPKQHDYWTEAIEAALDEAGVRVTGDEFISIVKSLETSRDNECLMNGSECIPNPLGAVVRELRQVRESESKTHDARIEDKDRLIETLRREVRFLKADLYEARNKTAT